MIIKTISIVTVLIINGLVNKVFSQDTLYLISGRIIEAEVKKIDSSRDGYILYNIKGKHDKIKSKTIEKEDVYAICFYNKEKQIIYRTDSSKGYILNNDQMYSYILGEQMAFKEFRTHPLLITGGAITGLTGGVLGVYGLLLPATYTAGISLISPKPKNPIVLNPANYKLVDYYKMGYSNVAKSKNIKNSLFAGLSGILVSAMLITIIVK